MHTHNFSPNRDVNIVERTLQSLVFPKGLLHVNHINRSAHFGKKCFFENSYKGIKIITIFLFP